MPGLLSKETMQLYECSNVQNNFEALTVIFHIFMLEKGFVPKGISEHEKFQAMPKNWNAKTIHQIFYSSLCCQEFFCCMTCISLYKTICVQGTVCGLACPESVHIKVKIDSYVKSTENFSDSLAVYQNLEELSRYFKDGFCLPLLNLLHENAGCTPLYGMRGLFDEIKVYMLEFLPVKDVLSMSAVNKNFNNLANSPHLWKYLFYRDFVKNGISDIDASSVINWKQKYKEKYLVEKRRSQPRFHMHSVIPWYPSIDDIYDDFQFPDPFEPSPMLPNPLLPPRYPYFPRQ